MRAQAFAGWVALSGSLPDIERLDFWRHWLNSHNHDAELVSVSHGWLLHWNTTPAHNSGATVNGNLGKDASESDILTGDWCCEAGPATGAHLAVASALMPAGGSPPNYPQIANGFAFCHWQAEGRILTLATDHLGCRPIYLIRQDDQILFSTDLPLLLEAPGISCRLNMRSIVNRLLAADAGRPDDTLFSEVQRISAGHLLRLTATETSCVPLPDASTSDSGPRLSESKDASQTLRECLIASVHGSLDGAETPAVHLSGGLDSAALACIAARALRQQGRTLLALCSVLPDGAERTSQETDEREYIAHVLEQEPNIKPIWVIMPADEHPFAALPQWFSIGGQAPYNTVTHALTRLGEAGRAHGVDVVLNGFGGDLFASAKFYGTTFSLFQQQRWFSAFVQLLSAVVKSPRAIGAELHPLFRRLVMPQAPKGRPKLLTEVAWQGFLAETSAPYQHAGAARRRLNILSEQQRMAEILKPGHLDLPVSGMCHFMSRAYGQTLSLPLLDPRVLKVALHADPREFTRDGLDRSLFRRAMIGILPEANRLRPNKGSPFDPALMSHLVANRPTLREWALDDTRPAWQVINRHTFLAALEEIQPASREHWRKDAFEYVIFGGVMGHFLDWQAGALP